MAKVKNLLDSDRRLCVGLISEDLNMRKTTAHKIISENLNMLKVCARLVLKRLSDEQKQRRVDASREILEQLESEPDFLDDVIIGDESRVFQYDPDNKHQSSE